MTTSAWCRVQDLLRGAPPPGRFTPTSKAHRDWLVERLVEAHAELMELRGGIEPILDEEGQTGEDAGDLLKRLIEERDELKGAERDLEELQEEHKTLTEERDALAAERNELANACDELRKRAEKAEAAP